MRPPRGLTAGEQAAWAHLAASVKPLPGKRRPNAPPPRDGKQPKAEAGANTSQPAAPAKPRPKPHPPVHLRTVPGASPPPKQEDRAGLDSHWDRRLKGGRIVPDLTLDLHDHSLDAAYDRIMAGLDQARLMDARVVLVIAGRERKVDPADRASARGAIRAKLLDWLAASRHAAAIGAVRKAHIRHGGEGALYLFLKRV